jgi:uncharacterized protein with GYD domain
MGVSLKDMYWTLGQYDQVCVFEAPDDETAATVLLAADLLGNIRTQTMRAFATSEMEKILAKVPWPDRIWFWNCRSDRGGVSPGVWYKRL